MFKKLFGKKKAPKTFGEIKEELLEAIREESLNKKANNYFNDCLAFLTDENIEETEDLIHNVFTLTTTLPMPQCSVAMSVCTAFFEQGYRNDQLIEKMVDNYRRLLKDSKPFFEMLHNRVKDGENGNSDIDIDVDSLYHELRKDENLVSGALGESVDKVEHFSKYMVSILSIDPSVTIQHKPKLKDDILFIKNYVQWCYWIDRLFDILFNEPIVVIDVDNNVGFEGKMSGVSDNFQLQLLLMAMPELNERPLIGDPELSVVNGTGIQISNAVVEGKWNMYNLDIIHQEGWEEIKIGPAKTYDLQDFWIWGEGAPHEISVHNGKRVVLLGRTPIKRSTRLQRTFKNVKAGIEVEKILTQDEINRWLGLN